MNRKGDIPITILVLGVVGICILAILSFSFSIGSGRVALAGPSLINDVVFVSEQIGFYEDREINFDVLTKNVFGFGLHENPNLKITETDDGNYLIKFSQGDKFTVEYNFVP